MIPASNVPTLFAVVTHGDNMPPLTGMVIGWRERKVGSFDGAPLYDPVVVWDNDTAPQTFDGLAECVTEGKVMLFASEDAAIRYADRRVMS